MCHLFDIRCQGCFREKSADTNLIVNVTFIEWSGTCIVKLIAAIIYGFHNKLVCLSLASLSSLVVVQGQTLQLITETVNYGRNKVYDTYRPMGPVL